VEPLVERAHDARAVDAAGELRHECLLVGQNPERRIQPVEASHPAERADRRIDARTGEDVVAGADPLHFLLRHVVDQRDAVGGEQVVIGEPRKSGRQQRHPGRRYPNVLPVDPHFVEDHRAAPGEEHERRIAVAGDSTAYIEARGAGRGNRAAQRHPRRCAACIPGRQPDEQPPGRDAAHDAVAVLDRVELLRIEPEQIGAQRDRG
jgi:hypothetical protein